MTKISDLMLKRRSIRRFKNIPVSFAALEKCADAARLARIGKELDTLERDYKVTLDATDPISKQTDFKKCAVKIVAA